MEELLAQKETEMSLEDLRRQYTMGGLTEESAPGNPIELFGDWMTIALENAPADWVEPYAMTLSTSDTEGNLSSRVVLLRGYDEAGFVFYTNYESAKGQQLKSHPQAALVFYWGYLERQVRVVGSVSKVSRELSESYFHKRPRGSQIGANVSRQSQTIASREELEAAVANFEAEVGDGPVPLPEDWGGYCVMPQRIEFWQGRKNRLHDRLVYRRNDSGWLRQRLSP